MTDVTVFSSDEVVPTRLPVDLSTSTPLTILRLAAPVLAGDVLDISADFQVTNDAGRDPTKGLTRYNVGVGFRLMRYNASAPSGEVRNATWQQIGTALGENVTPDGHHLAPSIGRTYVVPADWVPGDSIGIALRADAHSTAWNVNGGGEALTVDQHGMLIVRRYREPTDAPEVPPCG